MEALSRPPEAPREEPEFVLERNLLGGPPIRASVWAASLALHALVVGVLVVLSQGAPEPQESHSLRVAATLIAPPRELTQTAPNRGRIGREFSLENLVPRPPLRVPAAIPPMARAAQPPEPPVLRRPPALREPPSVDAAKAPLSPGPAPPPQIQAEEKPKLAFETPGRFSAPPSSSGLAPRLQPPGSSVMEAARAAVRGGRGGVIVGDQDLAGSAGIGGGLLQTPAPGRTATALEMLSDPTGVDFKPYLIQILASVKRNWLAVIPESARLGRAGRVAIEFAINRDGHVPKLVIAMPSGTDALDRAAVAGISASNPFPPLPSEFRGDQIRLQFTFSYNLR